MSSRSFARYNALAGLVGVVMLTISYNINLTPLQPNPTQAQLAAFLASHTLIMFAAWRQTVGIVLCVVFALALAHLANATERFSGWLTLCGGVLLVMTNLVYNSFGGDGGGIQCLLISPVSFRQIVFAKNLAQFTVLVTEILILWLGVCLIYNPPRLVFLALTFCWYLFATPVNFSIGNLLSLYSPKKIDYAVFGRQRASETTIFASLGVQLVIMGIGALTIFIGYRASNYWIGVLILAALAIPSITGYIVVLRRIDPIVMTRREVLATELCKA